MSTLDSKIHDPYTVCLIGWYHLSIRLPLLGGYPHDSYTMVYSSAVDITWLPHSQPMFIRETHLGSRAPRHHLQAAPPPPSRPGWRSSRSPGGSTLRPQKRQAEPPKTLVWPTQILHAKHVFQEFRDQNLFWFLWAHRASRNNMPWSEVGSPTFWAANFGVLIGCQKRKNSQ